VRRDVILPSRSATALCPLPNPTRWRHGHPRITLLAAIPARRQAPMPALLVRLPHLHAIVSMPALRACLLRLPHPLYTRAVSQLLEGVNGERSKWALELDQQ
jgi:hypothetical protein